jgi:hypothetical protein
VMAEALAAEQPRRDDEDDELDDDHFCGLPALLGAHSSGKGWARKWRDVRGGTAIRLLTTLVYP